MMGEQHKLLHCTVPIQEKLAAQEKKQIFIDKIGGGLLKKYIVSY